MRTAPSVSKHVRVESVMGTVLSIDVRGERSHSVAVERAIESLHAADRTFSTYRDDSVISRLNRGELMLAGAPRQVRAVLERCEALRVQTGGYFDARAGGQLDPSALVKGWAVQRAAQLLAGEGATDFCITCGGDIACRGGALPADEWRIGIQHPLDPRAIAAVVHGTNMAVATSGTYERGAHIHDPHAGAPPGGVLSVTVVGPDLGTADAYSTAAFAMGVGGPAWTAALVGYEAMTILADETVLTTSGFPRAEGSV